MASVIIDEFEVVAEPAAAPGEMPLPQPPTPPPSLGPTPEDVRHVVRMQAQRAARLFAH
jgi:hypothetical protein